MHAHTDGHHLGMGVLLAASLFLMVGYLVALARSTRRRKTWSGWRTASFLLGMSLVAVSLSPPLAMLGHHDLRIHMLQHLLLGMLGPVGVVLGAPVTLTLRAIGPARSKALVAVLRSRFFRYLGHPSTALLLNLGGMAVLYATPLFAAMHVHPELHVAVHFHFFAAGCLFSWSIAGIDPGPHRPTHGQRLGILFVAIAAHATLAKLMFAHGLPEGTAHGATEIEEAAMIMYYGGDLSELLLAIALFASWRKTLPHRRGDARGVKPAPSAHSARAGA